MLSKGIDLVSYLTTRVRVGHVTRSHNGKIVRSASGGNFENGIRKFVRSVTTESRREMQKRN